MRFFGGFLPSFPGRRRVLGFFPSRREGKKTQKNTRRRGAGSAGNAIAKGVEQNVITVKVEGLQALQANLMGMQKQVRYAASRALNNVAFKANAEVKAEMRRAFKGGATPYTLSAFKVIKADKANLTAVVALRSDSGGKARSYDVTLKHLFTGGTRTWKGMEGAFRRIGVLPPGYMIVPGDACPLDGYGNPPKSLIVQLISYFNAFGEVGFKGNMTDKRRSKLAKVGKSASGYKTIGGVQYFVSRGRGQWYGRPQHLPAGIWSKTGIHGVDVKPIFMFVRTGKWRRFIDLQKIGEQVVGKHWQSEFDAELAKAMRNAK